MLQIFAPVCYLEHWWLWVADVRKKKFFVLDPYHKTCPCEPRMKCISVQNKGYVISKMRVYVGAPLKKTIVKIELPYIDISGQKIIYDCAVYVMKWLEIIQGKYEWDNWTQAKVDHFRVEFVSRILFHKMNRERE
ncbi:hypothetical protein Ahy_A04g018963 [Arachis hypogaea]|uniref:Ubiquitin-like protease family profile domain-containing protein n=1 Tax=Arachis hypogaea TaxID=3818 RepID=A0A445DEZ7_ARAHY|nr:hypothetical protein Ahy_A04g018963 [Arachis hypogaea]